MQSLKFPVWGKTSITKLKSTVTIRDMGVAASNFLEKIISMGRTNPFVDHPNSKLPSEDLNGLRS